MLFSCFMVIIQKCEIAWDNLFSSGRECNFKIECSGLMTHNVDKHADILGSVQKCHEKRIVHITYILTECL